jgi:hypothetical protein
MFKKKHNSKNSSALIRQMNGMAQAPLGFAAFPEGCE